MVLAWVRGLLARLLSRVGVRGMIRRGETGSGRRAIRWRGLCVAEFSMRVPAIDPFAVLIRPPARPPIQDQGLRQALASAAPHLKPSKEQRPHATAVSGRQFVLKNGSAAGGGAARGTGKRFGEEVRFATTKEIART